MKNFWNKILSTLDTKLDGGFSARKLTALAFVIMTLSVEVTWLISGEWAWLTEVLTVNVAFISTLLGLTTWESLKKKKEPQPNESNN